MEKALVKIIFGLKIAARPYAKRQFPKESRSQLVTTMKKNNDKKGMKWPCKAKPNHIWAVSWENRLFAYAKTKTQISYVVTAKLNSALVFAT